MPTSEKHRIIRAAPRFRQPAPALALALGMVLAAGWAGGASARAQDAIPASQVTWLYAPDNDGGYFLFVNNDVSAFSLDINVDSRTLYLRRDEANAGMFVLPSGSQFPVRVRKGEYKFYWGSGRHIKIKVREDQTTTVAFDAFGADATGLRLVAHDGKKITEETLFFDADEFLRYQSGAPDVIVYSTPVVDTRVVYLPSPPIVTLTTFGIINALSWDHWWDWHHVYYPPRHHGPPMYYPAPRPPNRPHPRPPPGGVNRPGHGPRPPPGGHDRPGSGDRPGGVRPPWSGNDRPGSGDRPGGVRPPWSGNDRPGSGDRPGGVRPPPGGNDRPGSGDRPGGVRPPPGGNDRPGSGVGRPSWPTTRPSPGSPSNQVRPMQRPPQTRPTPPTSSNPPRTVVGNNRRPATRPATPTGPGTWRPSSPPAATTMPATRPSAPITRPATSPTARPTPPAARPSPPTARPTPGRGPAGMSSPSRGGRPSIATPPVEPGQQQRPGGRRR